MLHSLSLSLHETGQCHTISFYYIINTVESRFVSFRCFRRRSRRCSLISPWSVIACSYLKSEYSTHRSMWTLTWFSFSHSRSLARSFSLAEYNLTVKFLQFFFSSLKCDRDWNLCVMLFLVPIHSLTYTFTKSVSFHVGILFRFNVRSHAQINRMKRCDAMVGYVVFDFLSLLFLLVFRMDSAATAKKELFGFRYMNINSAMS